MRNKKSVKALGVVFLFCIFFTGFWGTSVGQESEADEADYYIVDGQKIVLELSENYTALKLKPGTSDAQLKAFTTGVNAAGFGEVKDSPVLQKHNIVLVRIKKGVGPSSFREGTNRFKTNESVEMENPVYGVGGIDQILVNEFNVQFKPGASEEEIAQSIKNKNAEVVRKNKKIKNRYTIKFTGKTARESLAISNQYYNDPLVEFIEPNFIRIYPQRPKMKKEAIKPAKVSPASAAPSDTLYVNQWYLNNTGSPRGLSDADIDAPEAWAIHQGSPEIIIAIIDEGVDTSHKDLKDKIVTPYDATDGDDNQEPRPSDAHGTACAGIAAAMTNNGIGVAGIGRNVKIMPVRIAYSDALGSEWITTDEQIEDGIRTAVDRGAHVLSNSWGGGSPSGIINSAIDHAIANNRVVVFAAGNWSTGVIYPANLSKTKVIIAVSATNEWDQFKTKTSFDGEKWWGSCFGSEVNVSAPGVHIFTTDISGDAGYVVGDYISTFNGTSSATPLVAGTAALLLSKNPGWTPTQVRNQIQSTADDLGPSGFDYKYGHGRLNACNALGGSCKYERPEEPSSCSSTGAAGLSSGNNISQTLVNITLLFSTVLLFLLFVMIRKLKKRSIETGIV